MPENRFYDAGLVNTPHGESGLTANSYCERDWHLRAGTVELRIPKLRRGSGCLGFLESHRMAEKAPTAVIQEAYTQW